MRAGRYRSTPDTLATAAGDSTDGIVSTLSLLDLADFGIIRLLLFEMMTAPSDTELFLSNASPIGRAHLRPSAMTVSILPRMSCACLLGSDPANSQTWYASRSSSEPCHLSRPEQGRAWRSDSLFSNGASPMALKRTLPSGRPPPANSLLAALPADDYARLAPTLAITALKLRHFLHKPGEPIDRVYFPGGGFVSVVTVLSDGAMVEIATIGREGVVGMSAALNQDPSPSAAMVQGETDTCYTMAAETFRTEMDRRGPFYNLLTRYSHALVGFIMQSAACNAVHSVRNGSRAGC